jgi:hypothetical protein
MYWQAPEVAPDFGQFHVINASDVFHANCFRQRFGISAREGSSGSVEGTVGKDDGAYRDLIDKQFIAGQLSAVDFQKAAMDVF